MKNLVNKEEIDTFGKALRYYRQQNEDLTISDITDYMGWRKAYLMDIEKGRVSPPDITNIMKLCKILKIEDELFMIRLASKERNKLTIDIPEGNPEYLKTAMMLVARATNLNDETLKNIQNMMGGEVEGVTEVNKGT